MAPGGTPGSGLGISDHGSEHHDSIRGERDHRPSVARSCVKPQRNDDAVRAMRLARFMKRRDSPLMWFFLPPPDDLRRLDRTTDRVNELYPLAMGREDQTLSEFYGTPAR
jgi:hypothetical protein